MEVSIEEEGGVYKPMRQESGAAVDEEDHGHGNNNNEEEENAGVRQLNFDKRH